MWEQDWYRVSHWSKQINSQENNSIVSFSPVIYFVWPVWPLGHYFMLCISHFVQKRVLALSIFNKEITVYVLIWSERYVSQYILFQWHIAAALVLIEDIIQMWQDACHIWKYCIIKCYQMLVNFTEIDRH